MEQLHPGTSAYNLQLTLRIDGPVDVGILRRGLNEIVRRHSVLRACFRAVDGRPRAFVAGQLTVPVSSASLTGQPDADAQAIELAAQEANEPFDLEHGPLIRARIIQVAADRHLLCWTVHHIVADDWSFGLMMRELARLYAAMSAGQPSPLPPLPLQYWDYVSWQRGRLQDATTGPGLAYWRRVLTGAPLISTFPPDVPRPDTPVFRGSRRPYELPAQLTSAIDQFARRERVTSYMVLLAGLAALLHRDGGHDDVVIGVPTAGRYLVEFEDLVGPFLNTLPIRVTPAAGMPFSDLLRQVRTAALMAYQHQEIPFGRLVEELRPPRRASVHSLYQVMLAMQNALFTASELPGLTVTAVPLDVPAADRQLCTVLLDLTVCLRREATQFVGNVEYNAALFRAGTVDRLLQRYADLLARAVTDPGLTLARLSTLPPEREGEGPAEAIDLALRALAARAPARFTE
jgi:hypothetical protein